MEDIMHMPVQDVPGTTTVWAGLSVGYWDMPAGTDFTPFFEGLPDNLCSCTHWGYVTKGALHLRYADGTVEVIPAGNVFYAPAGHTAWSEEDSAFLDFNPEAESKVVMDHIARKAGQST
jgi:hypothetical protein